MFTRHMDILPTGQLWFTKTMLGALSQGISPVSFQVLTMLSAIEGASFHTKPMTDSCETAVTFRVPNDYAIKGIGVDLEGADIYGTIRYWGASHYCLFL